MSDVINAILALDAEVNAARPARAEQPAPTRTAPVGETTAKDGESAVDADSAIAYIFGGKATVTVASRRTGKRNTFSVKRLKDDDDKFFVGLLTGPDNGADYTYVGMASKSRRSFWTTRKSAAGAEGVLNMLRFAVENPGHPQLEVLHAGRCSACGRKLTTPESIKSGLGPVCAGRA